MRIVCFIIMAAALLWMPVPAQAEDGVAAPRQERLEDFLNKRGDMTEEERAARRERMKERFDSLPPEKQEEIRQKREEHAARREAIKKELMALPPEERDARMEELRAEFKEKHEEHRAEKLEKFRERWESATPEERERFCRNARERCAEGGGKGYGCKAAKETCASD